MKKQIAFIINPISGVFHKDKIPTLIRKNLDLEMFEPEIIFTQYAGHASKIAKEYVEKGFDYVVAVGGDGTVNETACALRHSHTALGIIPTGSGNGLARHLHIPMRTKKAIKQLNAAKTTYIDYGLINDKPFFCTCGVGFDAQISIEFGKVKRRGVFSYLRKIFIGFFNYSPRRYTLRSGDMQVDTEAFLITMCNASQWGNNAYIAPKASLKDGYFDVVVLRNVGFFPALRLAAKLYNKKLDNNQYIKTWKTKELTISSDEEIPSHLDGEPFEKGNEVQINIVHAGLKVFCAGRFQ